MISLWKKIFGTAWDELINLSPDICGILINKADKSVMIDANARRLLGLSADPGYDRVMTVIKALTDQPPEAAPLSCRLMCPGDDVVAALVRVNRVTQTDPKLCGRGNILAALTSAGERSMLAMIEIQAYEGVPPAFAVQTVINGISEIEPSALISCCGKRKYWLFIPDAGEDPVDRLRHIRKGSMESMDDLTFTAGIGSTDKEPMQRMDTAESMLYQANIGGKGTIQSYSEQLYAERTSEIDHDRSFAQLVDENLFVYSFQPIVSSHNGSIFAYEALMRTENSIGLTPDDVISCATRANRLYDVERCTMLNALSTIANHREEFTDKKLFVNSISAHMLVDEDWAALKHKFGDVMDHLVIELTEQTEMQDDKIAVIKDRIMDMGIFLAIDDYGTGYSNTSNLLRYSPDFVKIDRSLIIDINKKPKIQQLVSGIIEFIHSNGYVALAEGVETYDELKVMIQLGADLIQGYYCARPRTYLQTEISENVINEIIRINNELVGEVSRYCHPANNEVIDLFSLSADHYSAIFVEVPHIVVKGRRSDTPINIPIVIKDGLTTKVDFEDVCLTTEKDIPLITVGAGASLELCVMGVNKMFKRGIYVPEGASFTLSGSGSLEIQASLTSSYGIGTDKDQNYGDITLGSSGRLTISSFGDTSVGIGGGRNEAAAKIRVLRGDIRINCEGSVSVGVGTIKGHTDAVLDNCSMSVLSNSHNAVGVGSIEGSADITMNSFRVFVDLSGIDLCGIGVWEKGTGSITVSNGSL
ncbi:MAG: EAL domain-containing protein, partial [Oscillospiraceae bacterium]|nr:EAL domain-containing protein [Oscillospiraceae bacterium]